MDLKVENVFRSVEVDGPMDISSTAADLKIQREMQLSGMETQDLGGTDSKGFLDMLKDSVNKVNSDQMQADEAIHNLLSGRTKNIHETLLAVERADASLKLMMQVRNKILDGYREIMRMQV